jgi:hypothetical protein
MSQSTTPTRRQVAPEPQIITTGITNRDHCRLLTVTRAGSLGLHAPLEGQAAFREQARATSPSAPCLVETPGPVDVNAGTIDLSATLDDGDSFQHWVVDPDRS